MFATFTTGSRTQPDTIYVNAKRVIWIQEDTAGGGSVLHCNDGEKLTVFESPKDAVTALTKNEGADR